MQDISCFHCGLPVIVPGQFADDSAGQHREFCCGGCLAVASFIGSGGLDRYYALRDAPGNKPEESDSIQFEVYDNPNLQKTWIIQKEELAEGELLVEGINCSACIWLIESWLSQLPGIQTAEVNYGTHKLHLSWDPERIKPSRILREIHNIGYHARPYSREAHHQALDQQRSSLLKRLGVSAALGMQIMIISVALYTGEWFGIEPGFEEFLKKINLLLSIPLILYCAKPFYQGAMRSIRTLNPGMDLSVSLGVTLAFLGSVFATVTGHGDVYFDSVAMFVFFLLGARFIELSSRIKATRMMDPLADIVPAIATRVENSGSGNTQTSIPVVELKVGDLVAIKPGDVLPADGIVVEGESSFEESLLTGEPEPIQRPIGSKVLAGSINLEQATIVRVTATPDNTIISSILRLAERASSGKPGITMFAERIAKWFVLGIILLAIGIALTGFLSGKTDWLPITIAVLVVTCPCALSLATPLALAAGANGLIKHGIFVASNNALETLNKVDHFMMDKTGTVTMGTLQLEDVRALADFSEDQALGMAAALEKNASHPMALSLVAAARELPWPDVSNVKHHAGRGLSGEVNGQGVCIGSLDFVQQWLENKSQFQIPDTMFGEIDAMTQPAIVLCSAAGPLALFVFRDKIRPGAAEWVQYLNKIGASTSLVSGDRIEPVRYVAEALKITDTHAKCTPEDKLRILDQVIDSGKIVSVVGDGINDTPAMGRSHLAVVLARAVNLLSARADIVVTGENLNALIAAKKKAEKTYRIIQQNIIWALVYNICAIPAALAGWVPPWLAGIGMSLSSVIVVLNASRLSDSK